MCMQCVAQSAPFLGVAVTMLNRRNIKTFVTGAIARQPRGAEHDLSDQDDEAPAGEPASEPAPSSARDLDVEASERVAAGV
jgi:hypothetical protein